jgi:hypothetical protein
MQPACERPAGVRGHQSEGKRAQACCRQAHAELFQVRPHVPVLGSRLPTWYAVRSLIAWLQSLSCCLIQSCPGCTLRSERATRRSTSCTWLSLGRWGARLRARSYVREERRGKEVGEGRHEETGLSRVEEGFGEGTPSSTHTHLKQRRVELDPRHALDRIRVSRPARPSSSSSSSASCPRCCCRCPDGPQ